LRIKLHQAKNPATNPVVRFFWYAGFLTVEDLATLRKIHFSIQIDDENNRTKAEGGLFLFPPMTNDMQRRRTK
jgi:hypothetical protein